MSNNEWYLYFNIGPVQEFLSYARKAGDLWMGSYLFSYLSAKAKYLLMQKLGCQVIYPVFTGDEDDKEKPSALEVAIKGQGGDDKELGRSSIPDVILAKIQNLESTAIEGVLTKVSSELREELARLASEAVKKIFTGKIPDFEYEQNEQIRAFLAINYVLLPAEKDGYNYKNLAALNSGVAGIRSFKAISATAKHQLNCSLCGKYPAAWSNKDEPFYIFKQRVRAFWDNCFKSDPHFGRAGEVLCPLCALKRAGAHVIEIKGMSLFEILEKYKIFDFPSTYEIAAAPFKKSVCDNANTNWNAFKRKLVDLTFPTTKSEASKSTWLAIDPVPKIRKEVEEAGTSEDYPFNVDSAWLFEDNLSRIALNRAFGRSLNSGEFSEDDRKELVSLRKKIIEKLKTKKINNEDVEFKDKIVVEPSWYYSAFILDGDSMGETLSKINNSGDHQQLSKEICGFAYQDAYKIVEEDYFGKVIYSGGDDIRALIHPQDLIKCVCNLEKTFSQKNSKGVTLSGGACIAHVKTPIRIVYQEVQKAEKRAKEFSGKNAFSISYIPHSGNPRVVVLPFHSAECSLREIFEEFYKLRIKDKLSDAFIHNLRSEFKNLFPPSRIQFCNKEEQNEDEGVSDPFKSELIRLGKRASELKSKDEEEQKNDRKEIVASIEKIWRFKESAGLKNKELLDMLDIFNLIIVGMMRERGDHQ